MDTLPKETGIDENEVAAEYKSNEENFGNLLKQAPAGILILRGTNFIAETANDYYLEIVGRNENDFIGKPLFDVLPEVKNAVEPLLSKVLETGIAYYGTEFPVMLNRYGKSELTYFNFIYKALKEKDGKISGIIVFANEVTQLVHSKKALAESEKYFRNLIMNSPIAMAIFKGEDFVIDMANKIMFEKMWRKKEEEVINKKLLDIFPELMNQKYPQLLQKVFATGETHRENESVAYVMGNDGMKKFYLDYEYAPLIIEEGKVWGIVITVNDVTEKVETRQKIEAAEARARIAIEAAELGIYELDVATDALIVNDRFNEIFGTDNFLDRDGYRMCYHPEDRQKRMEARKNYTLPGAMDYDARIIVDNNIRWIRSKAKVLFEENKPVKVFGTVQDITAQKEFLNELESKVKERTNDLQELNKILERSNDDLQQFAHVASHDLKEPVRKIKIFSHRLQDEYKNVLDENGNNFLDKIINSTNRIYSMIDGVLNYSTITSAGQSFEKVDLEKIILHIKSDLEILIHEKNALIDFDHLPMIEGIPDLLYQLFYNLINNSLKFSQKDQQTIIGIRSEIVLVDEKKFVKIVVSDNGIGFENKFSEDVFSTFTRLNSKDKFEGTGLGLALCKKVVMRHNGFISANAKVNEGANFIILLPTTTTHAH